MSLDVVAYANEHGYRLRNVHDGGPVPPAWRPVRSRGRPAHFGADDRCDAIPGRHGYVTAEGPDRIGWCLLTSSRRALTARLPRIEAANGRVTQTGETEAAGWASIELERLGDLLRAKAGITEPGPTAQFLADDATDDEAQTVSAKLGCEMASEGAPDMTPDMTPD